MPNGKTVTTDFPTIVKAFDDLGYTLSFEGYTDELGSGNKAIAIHRGTKKRRTMMDRHYARDCISISAKLLAKIQERKERKVIEPARGKPSMGPHGEAACDAFDRDFDAYCDGEDDDGY